MEYFLNKAIRVADANIKKYIMVSVKNNYINKIFTIAIVVLTIKYVVVNVNITISDVNW